MQLNGAVPPLTLSMPFGGFLLSVASMRERERRAPSCYMISRFVLLCSECNSIRVVASLGVYACFAVGVIQALAHPRNFPSFLAHLRRFSARSMSRVTLSECLIIDVLILPPLLHHNHLLHCEHRSVSRALHSTRDDALFFFFFTLTLTACGEGGITEPQTHTHTRSSTQTRASAPGAELVRVRADKKKE
ncbi:hypothetical protein LMJF_33_1535 [Leishmania major strain Friedlin]|uniref:Uncharacterized protein n=1 Tax=Leishmania major TaxID=5664 RepID=E9AEH1_LEIMA|nr:hypothetical protein LMJF_33_1535 [Leishmania major strain Friedlin]CAG9580733.1 hypothetical_protein_-_conserved [Leishmania major strain Friedlin]CBZ05886.1 hypothetical protein LMJF_33_1535 [Leishmania major strain Friedlin]|eukprot:XP_003722391.1 hypothetical protein LMJF_33_1535 [Leishmania major strain Friedlin]